MARPAPSIEVQVTTPGPSAQVQATGEGPSNQAQGENAADQGNAKIVEIVDDPVSNDVAKAYLGSIVVDVRELQTTWDSSKKKRNRAIDADHVQKLQTSFQYGIRRFALEDRLNVTTSETSFKNILKAYLILSRPVLGTTEAEDAATVSPETPDDREARIANESVPEEEIEGVRGNCLRRTRLKDEMLIVDYIPRDATLTLRNGQHRVAALKGLCENMADASKKEYYWAIDVYAQELLSSEAMDFISVNKDSVKKPDSEGYTASRLIAAWEELNDDTQIEYLKEKAFKKWVNNVFQIQLTHSPRMIAVMRHAQFRKLTARYCATRYGERSFAWSVMYGIINSKLDCLWIPLFKKFFKFSRRIFPKLETLPSYEDWKKISELPEDRPDPKLRLLFFPTLDDYYHAGKVGKKALKKTPWPLGYESRPKSLPQLKTPVTVESGERCSTRRPNFLVLLSDQQYVQVYNNLRQNRTVPFPTWHQWSDLESKVSRKVKSIVQHTLTWVDPVWQMPAVATDLYKSMLWETEVYQVMYKDAVLAENGVFPWGDEQLSEERARSLVCRFLQSVWDQVESDESWKDTLVIPQTLREPPAALAEENADELEEVKAYLTRFELGPWCRIVTLVLRSFGPIMTGAMDRFNAEDAVADIWRPFIPYGPISVDANFTHNRHLRHLKFLNNAESRASLTHDFDIVGSKWEYRELKQAMLNTLKHGMKRRALNRAGAKQGTVITTKEEYQDARSKILELAYHLQLLGVEVDVEDYDEPLDQLDLDPPPARNHERREGFTKAEPKDYSPVDVDVANMRARNRNLAASALEVSRKRAALSESDDSEIEPPADNPSPAVQARVRQIQNEENHGLPDGDRSMGSSQARGRKPKKAAKKARSS